MNRREGVKDGGRIDKVREGGGGGGGEWREKERVVQIIISKRSV